MEVGQCARGVQRRAGGTSARSTDCGCGRKIKGQLQVRVQYVEAVYMRAGAKVTVCQRGSAGAVRGGRGRGSEVEGTKVPTSPKVGVWRTASGRSGVMHAQGGGARAKARCAVEQECAMRMPRLCVDLSGREGSSKRSNCE
ncbi:hypothetical protein B0H13DRAFT_1920998 [Mycena leptocephala]|nr:hypothetical protein B0H13DRAFT_1920998 [Mycena leptocephala]